MHVNLRLVGKRERGMPLFWIFPYGFGLWIHRLIFSVGHDTRLRASSNKRDGGR